MTNLTEKLKKGELPDNHHYYFKLPKSKEYEVGNTFCLETLRWCKDGDKIEVLSEVPSYDELQNMNKAVNECMAANIKLVEQNRKLKELLKECEHMIIAYSINNNTFTKEEIKNIISKIDQVLGEE